MLAIKNIPRIYSFAPIEDAAEKVLILSSMLGKESLIAGQYYAHPRNAFWLIMGNLIGANAALPYELTVFIISVLNFVALWLHKKITKL